MVSVPVYSAVYCARGEQSVTRAGGETEALPGLFRIDVEPGDSVEVRTPGGGGYGEG